MAIRLKQSTASQEVPLGYFVSSTDGDTEATGLTIANTDIKLWKMGATALANKNSGGATHISNGIYYAVLDATDTNTLGALVIFVHVSAALAVRVECEVLPAVVYDAWIAGTDNFDVSVTQWTGTNVATPTTAGVPEVDVTHWNGTAIPAVHTAGYPIVTVKDGTGTGEIDTTSGGVLVSTLATQAKADVNAEVLDVLATDTFAEVSGVIAATSSLKDKINWLFALTRNKLTQTATTTTLRNDADSGDRATSTTSDNGTTMTRGEWS
jgi:hypothetical protein